MVNFMKVLILLTDTGGGHHRASLALKNTIEQDKGNEVVIEDALMYSSRFLHFVVSKLYLLFATKTPKLYGKIYNSADKVSFLDKAVHSIASFYSRRLFKLFQECQPDCVICCHAFCSDMVAALKKKGKINTLMLNIITDFASHSAYINSNVDAYIVASDDMVKELREKYRINGSIVYPYGIPIYDCFYKKENSCEMREKLGLNPYKKTVLMMAGSFGVTNITEIFTNLNKYPSDYQLVVVTGRNEKLFNGFQTAVKNGYIRDKKGNNIKIKIPTKLCYFVNDIENYMSAADIIVTKPGGLTVSESIAKELPMAIFRSYDGQEKDNAEYLEKHSLAVVMKEGREGVNMLNKLLDDDVALQTMRNNLRTFKKEYSSKNIYRLIKEKL